MGKGNGPSFLIAMTLLIATQGVGADKWDDADVAIRRLAPTGFQGLPNNIVGELKKRGCTIPQSYGSKKPHNIISGEFAKKGQKDWAVLCSRNGSSSVLIFWGDDSPCPSEILPSRDGRWLQGIGDGRFGYSRAISPVGRAFIMGTFKNYGGPTPPPILHQGINEAFIEKASTVHYCHKGKWIWLSGGD